MTSAFAAPRRHLPLILCCLPWLALLGWLASRAWFFTDDAFISFRYAGNLIEGHGLVLNPGERVEGYTSFLWTLELAGLWAAFGLRPEHAAQWLSVACTAGTLAAVLWWVARCPGLRDRALVAWMALGLLCASATVAVWTSGGGLETRQFTLFVVVAVVLLTVPGGGRRRLLAASLMLALAEYSRPEGLLLAGCCFAWFVMARLAERRLRRSWRELLWLVLPFAALVAAHYLWRYGYYGEWLPNTYYAKHVRPWYESGFRYLWAAALETGLYLLIPLALVALRRSWRASRDLTWALPFFCIVPHMAYVLRLGGDYFEFRPLDFYWPLLAVPAAVGMAALGTALARRCRRLSAPSARVGRGMLAVAVFVPVTFYSSAIQMALLFEGAAVREWRAFQHFELTRENAPWLLAAPGMPALVAISNDLRGQMAPQLVASRFGEHNALVRELMGRWESFRRAERGIIPESALTHTGGLGVQFHYLPDLRVVDRFGLADKVIARNPVSRPNSERIIAHDRSPPPAYLEERGINIRVLPSVSSRAEALEKAPYAVRMGSDLWMPFTSPDQTWVMESFPGDRLAVLDPAGFMSARANGIQRIVEGPFEVYLDGDRLTYFRRQCTEADTAPKFFLHLVPRFDADMPAARRRHGFVNRDFRFGDYGVVRGGSCMARLGMPAFPVGSISTGQLDAEGGRLWDRSVELARP